MTERLVTPYGILLRDSERAAAAFVSSTMATLRLDLPAQMSLSEAANLVGMRLNIKTANDQATRPADDPFDLNDRRVLLPLLCEPAKVRESGVQPSIRRLTINVSNACNLWCSYCYADKGLYHAPKSFMAPDAATALVSRVLEAYNSVGSVQFFGGEPLMNVRCIDAVCAAFSQAVQEGKIAELPKFVATTNGTLSAPDVLDVLSRWRIDLTVSHDGPRLIHDKNRPTGNGKRNGSSFDKIAVSLSRFDDAGITYDLECTYNSQHLASDISVVNLLDFFHEMTGQRTFHIAPAFLPKQRDKSQGPGQLIFRGTTVQELGKEHLSADVLSGVYREAARYTMKNVSRGTGPRLSFADEMVRKVLARRPSTTYCPAFFNQLSVAVDGSAYPCFMFIGDPRFRLGNLLTDDLPLPGTAAVLGRYFSEFGTSPVGTEKWFAPLNSGCVAGEYITSSSLADRTMEPIMEAIAEEVVLGIAYLDQQDRPTESVSVR
ncbi:radical SAM protein [Streptomyces sp. NPDC005151]